MPVAFVHGIANGASFFQHYYEIGGGQPKGDKGVLQKRLECIYDLDRARTIRRSHENPTAQAFYKDKYLGGFGSDKAHELLHVEPVYKKKMDAE